MFFNIIIGFVLPWILGIILFFKDKKVLYTIFPFSSMIAFIVIALELDIGFWKLEPLKYNILPAIPFCLGLFPIHGSYLIYFIKQNKIRPLFLILFVAALTTIYEGMGLLIGKVHYENGWKIHYTFLSYFIPCFLCYWYYMKLKTLQIVE